MPDDEPERNAHSPQLDEPLRSREREALDIAVKALRETRRQMLDAVSANLRTIDKAMDDIDGLVPDAVRLC